MERAFPLARCTLSRALPKSVTGDVNYNCGMVDDGTQQSDNYLTIRFDPSKQDVPCLIDPVIPALISALVPYCLIFTDENIDIDDWRERVITNGRTEVGRFGMVTYLDCKLCRAAFDLTPAGVKKCVAHAVESVTPDRNGVLVVLSGNVLESDELRRRGAEVRNLLPNSPFLK